MKLSLRKALPSDIEYLVELRTLTMGEYIIQLGGSISRAAALRNLDFEFDHAKIIQVDNEDAGFHRVIFNQEKNEIYLDLIQVHPKFQGKGIASQLIQRLIDEAEEKQCGLTLSAFKINPAQNLYKRMGFVQVGETDDEYLFEYRSAS
ncbi:GNAT family N-acetyltransferase [Vibrio tubiashii]|uniref:GNAT family N-acetyltransferase n=1 Tax=Vibrio tubiashii TaxID=29498 RepID=UPI00349E73C9